MKWLQPRSRPRATNFQKPSGFLPRDGRNPDGFLMEFANAGPSAGVAANGSDAGPAEACSSEQASYTQSQATRARRRAHLRQEAVSAHCQATPDRCRHHAQ